MARSYNVAVVGATGNVGREIMRILDQRRFPVSNLTPLASSQSRGKQVQFGERSLVVQALDDYDFADTDLVLSSAGSAISQEFAPRATPHAVVVDNTSHFRTDPDIPLVIPEVNLQDLDRVHERNIVANPNCSTIAMLMALAPLHRERGIRSVVVSTYQSVSGAGKAAMDELFDSTKAVYTSHRMPPEKFPKPIAFNVIPQIDVFLDDGSGMCKEEWKMQVETVKMLDSSIKVAATAVRVPVFVGHALSVSAEFSGPLSVKKAHSLLRQAPGVTLVDAPQEGRYVTPKECVGEDDVFVSRVRPCPVWDNGLSLWIVNDNVRKGAALNAVQIAEHLIKRKLLC